MKVFVSWSGNRSQKVAISLQTWLKRVIQSIEPCGSQQIEKGSIWFTEIFSLLKDCSVGIICLTNENKDAPWILFETGALAKGLDTNRVCPLLIDIQTSDVREPISQFNLSNADKEGMWKLITTINCALDKELSEATLRESFETRWQSFSDDFQGILRDTESTAKIDERGADKPNELLSEILENTRTTNRLVSKLTDQSKRKQQKEFYSEQDKWEGPSDRQRLFRDAANIYAAEGLKFNVLVEELCVMFPHDDRIDLIAAATTAKTSALQDNVPF